MDQTVLIIITLVVGLIAGGLLGWFVGSRPAAELRQRWLVRDGEARDLDEKFKAAIRDLAGASEKASRADRLGDELALTRQAGEAARAELATLKANAAHFDEQKKLLVEAREELLKEFQNTGSAVLGKAQEAFLKAASERFGHAEKASEEKIKTLLAPVGESSKNMRKQVETLEKQRVDAFGQLGGLIQSMRDGQEAGASRGAAARQFAHQCAQGARPLGRTGACKTCSNSAACRSTPISISKHSMDTDEGRLRPDAIVRIPGRQDPGDRCQSLAQCLSGRVRG